VTSSIDMPHLGSAILQRQLAQPDCISALSFECVYVAPTPSRMCMSAALVSSIRHSRVLPSKKEMSALKQDLKPIARPKELLSFAMPLGTGKFPYGCEQAEESVAT
jgi:hypothetical protein